ncbi:MAG TPA: cysteine dioxygenase family protein [Solirubrobacteraceae bacterium]|jgi:predicted metal-dependent enzyme (double-stranded beta helix superfamily)
MIDLQTGRDLTREELSELVADLAARPDEWRHLVDHDPDVRTYEQLLRDEHVAVWLICWMDDHDTGFHDHDVSCGALAVAQGTVVEERLALGGPPASRRLGAGQALHFAASDIHRVAHGGDGPAITINAYSPPLWRMGAYETKPSGELQRHSISYAEELRPLGVR